MNLQIYDFDASVNIPQFAAYEQARPTGYTPCELQELKFLGAMRLCKSEICARGAICAVSLTSKLVDSALLDYVASGSTGRAGLSSRLDGATTKRGQPQGLTSFCWWTN